MLSNEPHHHGDLDLDINEPESRPADNHLYSPPDL